jgi:hypothetical protein
LGASAGGIFGLMLVRNAADLVDVNVRHHLELGVDRILAIDNGSGDGTAERLEALAGELPVEVDRDPGPYKQAELMARLGDRARDRGAEWLMPIDADEFFVSARPLSRVLAETEADAISVELVNFVQRHRRRRPAPRGLLTMDHRPARTIPQEEARYHVEAGEWSVVEVAWQRKLIARARVGIRFEAGAHKLRGGEGAIARSDEVVCLHAPLRARSSLVERFEHSQRLAAAGMPDDLGWQSRALEAAAGDPERLWRANSNRRGHLIVGGEPRALVRDPRLRQVARRHVPGRISAALSWARGRL